MIADLALSALHSLRLRLWSWMWLHSGSLWMCFRFPGFQGLIIGAELEKEGKEDRNGYRMRMDMLVFSVLSTTTRRRRRERDGGEQRRENGKTGRTACE